MSEATSEGNPRSAAPGAQQHSVALSAALHLLPGILIAAFYFLVGVPIAEGLGYPSLFGLLLSVIFVLVPSELGWLLYLGSRRNGRPSLEGVVLYRERMPFRRLVLLGLALLVWAVFVSTSCLGSTPSCSRRSRGCRSGSSSNRGSVPTLQGIPGPS
jgi:hypothetical protein